MTKGHHLVLLVLLLSFVEWSIQTHQDRVTSTLRAWPSDTFLATVLATEFRSNSTGRRINRPMTTSVGESRNKQPGQARTHATVTQINGTYGTPTTQRQVKGSVTSVQRFPQNSKASQRSQVILRKTVLKKISSKMINKTSVSNSSSLSHKSRLPFTVVPLEFPSLKEYEPFRPSRRPTILREKYSGFKRTGPSRISHRSKVPIAIPFQVIPRVDPTHFPELEEVMYGYPPRLKVNVATKRPTLSPIHEWIETEENSLEGVSPSPSLPEFPKLTWPYKNPTSVKISTTLEPPPVPPVSSGPPGDDKRSTGSSVWQRVPTVHVTPFSTSYPTSQDFPRPSQPPSKSHGIPHNTNIWYKPTITYVGSPPSQEPPEESSKSPSVVLRVWNFLEDKTGSSGDLKNPPGSSSVQLVSEKEIPPWALQGLGEVVPQSILNMEGLPQAVRDLVEQAIRKEEVAEEAEDLEGRDKETNESRGNPPAIQVNYVLWKRDNKTSSPQEVQGGLEMSLEDYASLMAAEKPLEPKLPKTNSPESETWKLLHKLLIRLHESQEVLDKKVSELSVSTPPSSPPTLPSLSASLPHNVDRSSLMANLAALVVLSRHLNSSLNLPTTPTMTPVTLSLPSPGPQAPATPTMTPVTSFSLSPGPQVPLNLTIHLLRELMLSQSPPLPTPPPTLTSTFLPLKDSSLSTLKSKTLLLQGRVKKGIKPIKKKAKKFKKKLKKLGWGLLKKPKKKYWFDLIYDVDLHSLLKHKFLYILALKYAPAFFVLSLGLVPLSFLVVPILLKILYFKKKPRVIRIPVHVPEPYPVPWGPWGPPQEFSEGQGPHDLGDFSPGPSGGWPGPLESPSGLQEINRTGPDGLNLQEDSFKKPSLGVVGPVGHAYELGFDLGSKLSKITNIHDKEVLKILLRNKKDKIEELLDKWKLIHEGKGVKPYGN